MTLALPRIGITSVAGAAVLSLALVGSAAAKVATRAEPDPDAEPTSTTWRTSR